MQSIDVFAYVLPVYMLVILIEAIVGARHEQPLYEWKDFWSSMAMGAGSVLINIFYKLATVALFYFFFDLFKPIHLSLFGLESFGWTWWVWLLAVVGDDFTFYWHHRFSHTIRFLWAAHVVHHSSRKFNFGAGFRNSWTTGAYKSFFWIWMPLVGFEPLMVATAISLNSLYQFWLHSKLVPKLGILESFMNTPFLHQVHHSCNVEYLDKNHGGIFIVWDKLFGTFQPNEERIEPKFGVLKEPNSYNPLIIFAHEYSDIWRDVRKARTWQDKLKYIFYPPGWSSDQSSKTAKQLQAELDSVENGEEILIREGFEISSR